MVAAFFFASVRLRTAFSIPTPRNLVCSVLRHGIGLPSGGYPRNSLETLEVTEHRRFGWAGTHLVAQVSLPCLRRAGCEHGSGADVSEPKDDPSPKPEKDREDDVPDTPPSEPPPVPVQEPPAPGQEGPYVVAR